MFKKYIVAFGILWMSAILVRSPDICITAAKEGLLLWFNKMLPSLLPFTILINMLSQLNIMQNISLLASPLTQKLWKLPGVSLFVFIMGFIAGYPMGAKIIKQLSDSKTITSQEAEKLLCFTNNCGPLFIVGTVGSLMLNNISLGYFLLIVHMLSALLLSFIFSFYEISYPRSRAGSSSKNNTLKFSYLFNESVKNGMDTVVYIGAYIIFFSVIASMINHSSLLIHILNKQYIPLNHGVTFLNFLTGILELSNGANILSSSAQTSLLILALIACLIGFGGICVYFQTSYILGECSFSLAPYFIAKCMQGCLSFILCYILSPILPYYALPNNLIVFESKWILLLISSIIIFIYMVKGLNIVTPFKYRIQKGSV